MKELGTSLKGSTHEISAEDSEVAESDLTAVDSSHDPFGMIFGMSRPWWMG